MCKLSNKHLDIDFEISCFAINIILEINQMKSGGESLHLLLGIKNLNEGRKDKKYLIRVNNLDTKQHCQIDNNFQHNYEYIYKLWPCQLTHSEFLKIEMFEKVIDSKGEQLVKRGEASPLVVYSYEGEKFQFSGSKQQRCVLIMKFKAGAVNKNENQESSLQLQKLNETIESDLKKHQQQQKYYEKYLQQTNRYLNQLKNDKYLAVSSQRIQTNQKHIRYNDLSSDKSTYQQKDEQFLFEQPKNDRKWQKLNNGRYFSYNQASNQQQIQQTSKYVSKSFNLPEQQKIYDSLDIAGQIRRKRGRYFNMGAIKGERKRQNQMVNQAKTIQSVQKPQHNDDINEEQTYMTFNQRQPSKDTIIRQINYPIVQIKDEQFEQKEKKRRRYHSQTKESEEPRGFAQDIRRQQAQLKQVKDKNHEIKQGKKQPQQYILQFSEIKSRIYRGDSQAPKKLLVTYKKSKHSTTIQKPINKIVQWKNHIRLTNLIPTQFIICKLVSPNQYGFFTEGQVRILISDFLRCKSQSVKVYLYEKNIAVGHLKFQFKITKVVEDINPKSEHKPLERTERRPSSLPQIANQKKETSQRYSQTISKDDLERIQTKLTQSSRLKRKYSKLIQSPIYEQAKDSLQNRGQSTYFSKIRQKKLKLKVRAK